MAFCFVYFFGNAIISSLALLENNNTIALWFSQSEYLLYLPQAQAL